MFVPKILLAIRKVQIMHIRKETRREWGEYSRRTLGIERDCWQFMKGFGMIGMELELWVWVDV